MSTHSPAIFKLEDGIDAYNPAVAGDELKLYSLINLEPRLGRLVASKGCSQLQNTNFGEPIISYGMYHLSSRQGSNLYAFTRTKIFWFDVSTGLFEATPIYSGFTSSDDPYVLLPWYDALYATKPGCPLVRIQRKTVTVIAGGIFGRYGCIANGHLYLGAAGDEISNQLARLRWSDLDGPELWDIDANESEADYFDLEAEERGVTGISYQKGRTLAFSEDSIWAGIPIGFPGGFRHEPLFPGLGNLFHHSVVRAKEVDFFISKDNFYALNGLQPVPIGDQVFERFINDVTWTEDTVVRGFLDTRKQQVFWNYVSSSRSELWSVVFNYKENKWSERSAQGMTAFFDGPRNKIRGYTIVDDHAEQIDSVATAIDTLENISATSRQLACVPDSGGVYRSCEFGVNPIRLDSGGMDCSLETFDFYLDDFAKVKEVTKVILEAYKYGTVPFKLYIGTRKTQSDAISWSAAIDPSTIDSNITFFVRKEGVGRYIRFKITWASGANFVYDLRLLSIVPVVENVDEDATK